MLGIFKIRRNEWPGALLALLVLTTLHFLMISKFWQLFADFSEAHFVQFTRNYHMSGYDYFTYDLVSQWSHVYDVVRHPFLAEIWWPFYALNQALWSLTGANCAQLVVGGVLLFCGFYSFIFLHRTLTDVIGIRTWQATLLLLMFIAFGLVWVTLIVPDHFCLSMFCLTLTLYRTGIKIKHHEQFCIGETILLFTLTASITLSNGALVLLMILFTNGRKFFEHRFFSKAVIIPCMLMLSLALGMNRLFAKDAFKASSPLYEQTKWTNDGNNNRLEIMQKNFFGESLILHRKHILGDAGWNRPVIVDYSWKLQDYLIILIEVLLLGGIIAGCRSRFSWLLASIIAFNMFLHLVVGFAIKEVFIMIGHWGYTIPLIIAQVFALRKRGITIVLTVILFLLVSYLYAYHGYLAHRILTWPLVK